jgi:hypothetical protein
LLKRLGNDREKLAASFEGDGRVGDYPAIFPLQNALRTGSDANSKSGIKRGLAEWAERALLERAILRVISLLPQPGK